MSEENRVTVSILDKDYQIACRAEEHHELMRAASELDSRMREVRKSGSIVGLERIAIMVALNLCHELQQKGSSEAEVETQESIARIAQKLNTALAG